MNNIIIELCAEDRARLDRLAEAMEKAMERNPHACKTCVETVTKAMEHLYDKVQPKLTITKLMPGDPGYCSHEEPQNEPTTTEEVEAPAVTPTEAETATQTEEPPVEEVKPSVTLAQIQQKVVQLCAGFDGTKKAAVREIVNAYAKKVSDLPEDKWDEIWERLTELEVEG